MTMANMKSSRLMMHIDYSSDFRVYSTYLSYDVSPSAIYLQERYIPSGNLGYPRRWRGEWQGLAFTGVKRCINEMWIVGPVAAE